MKTLYGFIGLFCFFFVQVVYGGDAVTMKGRDVIIDEEGLRLVITCLDEHIVHVQAYPKPVAEIRKSLVVNDSCFQFNGFRVSRNKMKVTVKTARLTVEYDRVFRRIVFIDRSTGDGILAENSRNFVAGKDGGEKAFRVT